MLTRPSRRPSWFEPLNGMCCNFDDLLMSEKVSLPEELLRIPVIRAALQTWPHYIGTTMYCIPDPSNVSRDAFAAAHDIYHAIGNMYDRRKAYCRLRYDLLDHLIAHVEGQ